MELNWNEDLSIGIHEIDEQHKVLVDLFNELATAIREKSASTAAVTVLSRLTEYTHVHFAVEESMMRLFGYPDYEAHKKYHEELIEQLNDLQSKVFQENNAINFELLHFLRVWLVKHIKENDGQYAKHFLANGVGAVEDATVTNPPLASMWAKLWVKKN